MTRAGWSSLVAVAAFGAACASDAATSDDSAVVQCVPTACAADGLPHDQYGFRVGTNTFGIREFTAFFEAADGGEVEAVLGPQFSWMVVVAAATDGFACCAQDVTVHLKLVAVESGLVLGEITAKKRKMEDVGGGVRYLSDMLLVLGASSEWRDKEAVLAVELSTAGGGAAVQKTISFTIRATPAGSVPAGP
jgi:hypothetical protein